MLSWIGNAVSSITGWVGSGIANVFKWLLGGIETILTKVIGAADFLWDLFDSIWVFGDFFFYLFVRESKSLYCLLAK